jgi:hypothetical protein
MFFTQRYQNKLVEAADRCLWYTLGLCSILFQDVCSGQKHAALPRNTLESRYSRLFPIILHSGVPHLYKCQTRPL